MEARPSSTIRKRVYVVAGVLALVIAYLAIDRIVIYPSQSVGSDLPDTSDTGVASTATTAATAVRPRPLTSMEGFEYQAALSPDGSFIAFTWLGRFLTRHGVIYIMSVDGGTPIRLTDSEESEQFPAWSPDGTRIAFFRVNQEGGRDIIVKPILGGFETRVATFEGFTIELDWSTDGNFLAFQGTPEDDMAQGIYLVSLNSGELRAFTENHGVSIDVRPRFSPSDSSDSAFASKNLMALTSP